MPRHSNRPSDHDNSKKTDTLRHFVFNLKTAPACPTPQPCRPDPTLLSCHFHPIDERDAPLGSACQVAKFVLLAVFLALFSTLVIAQQPDSSPNSEHDAHAKMNERGDKGMGFSQTATTHHFLLKPTGGVIQAEANDPNDTASRDHIRMHMRHIAHAFASGDFDIPMFVHDTTPPGVPEMKRLASKISYRFQEIPSGARVVITTSDPEAKAAIHKFLRYQIDEHQTHDPTHTP